MISLSAETRRCGLFPFGCHPNRDQVRRAWDDVAKTYAERRDPTGSDAALIDDLLAACPTDPTVLYVGCGDGARTLANLPAGSVGVDISRVGLDLAHETVPDSRLVQGEMTALPIQPDSVDAITACHAVFHVPREDQPAVYREFARVLSPGGWLLMTLPAGRFQTVRVDARASTLDQLRSAGFAVERTETTDDPLGSGTEFIFASLDA